MAKRRKSSEPKKPLYTHIATGTIWELVKAKPVTLVPAFKGRSAFGETRQPTKITFARDYQPVKELR